MKLTKYLSFAVLAGAMLLTNCNKDDESTSPIRPSDAVKINFSVGGKQLTRSNPLGTTEEQAKFNEDDQIAVSVIAPNEQAAVTFKLGSDGSTWSETSTDFLRWKANTQTFRAVYPASAKDGFDLPDDQSDADKIIAADYMSVEKECTRPNNGTDISLTLERQTARIIVNIASYGNQYASENRNVSDVKINGITPYNPDNSDQYIALVLPSSIGDAFITLKDGEGNPLSVLRSDINPTFEAGYSYTFNLKVGKDGIKIGNVTVEDWDSGTIEGGKAYAVGEEGLTEEPITVTWDDMDITGYGTYSQEGVTLTSSNSDAHSTYNLYDDFGDNTFSTTSGKFTKIEIICTYGNISGWDKVKVGEYQPEPDWDPDYWQDIYKLTWTGEAESVTICADIFGIQSITFTIE
ncbi:MAG: fimbrillin family protein [Bacteroidales bacterium]|nr:fimbrillin family protein [Bacteroidales bacterium]